MNTSFCCPESQHHSYLALLESARAMEAQHIACHASQVICTAISCRDIFATAREICTFLTDTKEILCWWRISLFPSPERYHSEWIRLLTLRFCVYTNTSIVSSMCVSTLPSFTLQITREWYSQSAARWLNTRVIRPRVFCLMSSVCTSDQPFVLLSIIKRQQLRFSANLTYRISGQHWPFLSLY